MVKSTETKFDNINWNQAQFDAFVSLCYNSGNNFKSVMDLIVSGGDVQGAFTTIIYAKNQKTGSYEASTGLWRRRMDESEIYLYGDYNRNESRKPPF